MPKGKRKGKGKGKGRKGQGYRGLGRGAHSAAANSDTTTEIAIVKPGRDLSPCWAFNLRTDDAAITSDASAPPKISILYPANDPTATSEWGTLVGLFDSYRIKRVRLCYRYNNQSIQASSTASAPATNPVMIIYDPDALSTGGAIVTTTQGALEFQTCKAFDLYKNWIYEVYPERTTQGSQTGASGVVLKGGWLDTKFPSPVGIVQLFAKGLTASIIYGEAWLEYDVVFKNRV